MTAWERVADLARASAEKDEPPLVWAIAACSILQEFGAEIPSIELGRAMIADAPSPALMPFVDHCIAGGIVYPLHALALLTAKVIPMRLDQPETYMLYLNLLNSYIFSLYLKPDEPSNQKLVRAVLDDLDITPRDVHLEEGSVAVQFFLTLVWRLAHATAEDWSLPSDKLTKGGSFMVVDDFDSDVGRRRRDECSLKALQLVTKLMQNKRTCVLLRLARRNFSDEWSSFVKKLQYLEEIRQDATLAAPIEAGELLTQLAAAIEKGLIQEFQPSQRLMYKALIDTNSSMPFGTSWGIGRAAAWLPFDIFMEDALEGRRLPATSMIEALADLIRSLQAVQGASWHDLFIGLWTAALRHVNREREHIEGPKPHVESRLCMLLFIVPLASAAVIEEEELSEQYMADEKGKRGVRRAAFVSSLQVLGQFEGSLCPPPVAVPAANQAAITAASFVAGAKTPRDMHAPPDSNIKAIGNMRHLIVEVCISRGLLDTSAYLWPGYAILVPNAAMQASPQASPWTVFMEGAPLTSALQAALVSTPASRVAELEKVYQLTLTGTEDERVAAAAILCGASLIRSWSIQEHAIHFALRLLTPPATEETTSGSHLVPHASTLSAALAALTAVDAVHVLSLYGMFPELAAALLPICEVFGSMSPTVSLESSSGEDVSAHMVFTLAFLLLLRLWKFHRPPLEHRLLGIDSPLGGDLSLDYILQLRNSQIKSHLQANRAPNQKPVCLDSFPKLKAWYTQNQACVASTLSGLVRGDPVHQIADKLLHMMFKQTKTNTSAATPDDTARPMLPAWDILTAVPFVLDAVLTACGHGRLSSRDLTTGLRDLVDFLPASIATIVSYFTAEVTRGLWDYAPMNGNDWPSPAANLLSVEAEIKDILAATGVQVPNLVTGSGAGSNAPTSLPLPLAAFLSLTITFKQDKASELVLGLAGPALESTAGGSPWPSMPVVAALWAQKIKRWHSFIVFCATRTVFKHDKGTVKQLLRSCFSVTTGLDAGVVELAKLQVNGGVGALLGHGGTQGGPYPFAPGILYLRVYPSLHEVVYVASETLALVVGSVRKLTAIAAATAPSSSFATSIARVLQASTLGASLLHISGGSTLVQNLYSDSLPTWFLSGSSDSSSNSSNPSSGNPSSSGAPLEGYAIAHFAILSGALAWGISPSSGMQGGARRKRVLGSHMDFIAAALDGKLELGCGSATWKAYVTGFMALLVTSTPAWIGDLRVEVLKRVARGLRLWQEQELAIALLERGGAGAMCAAAFL